MKCHHQTSLCTHFPRTSIDNISVVLVDCASKFHSILQSNFGWIMDFLAIILMSKTVGILLDYKKQNL